MEFRTKGQPYSGSKTTQYILEGMVCPPYTPHLTHPCSDKKKVTISGESAGALSVCAHFAAPKSFGLFSQVGVYSPY